MDVYQCPCCELRFLSANELLQHVGVDHPRLDVDSSEVVDAVASGHRRRHAAHYEASPDRNSH